MSDKLKYLIQTIPDLEPQKPVEEIVVHIIKHQFIRLWKKRISCVIGLLVLIFGFLIGKQIIRITGLLDTAGFFKLVSSDREWLLKEPLVVGQALLEASPWHEVLYLLFLLAILGYSGYILVRKD